MQRTSASIASAIASATRASSGMKRKLAFNPRGLHRRVVAPGEDPTAHPNTFIAFARDYRQRWGIENGFKVVKGAFLRKVRDTRPRRRQFNMMLGMLLCNYWHGCRLMELLKSCRVVTWNKKNYDSRRAWIRRKLEHDKHDAVTARGFLIRLLAVGIQSLIQKMFKEV